MSDVKFTPGPWCLSKQSIRIIKKDFSAIGSDDGFLIASSMGRDDSGFYASDSEADANAHLIAAAPDLYEALERSIDMLQDYALDYKKISGSNEVHPIHKEIIDQAEKALAKARGEQ